MDQYEVQQGRKYRVQFQDCCVEGEFTAVLAEVKGTDFGPDRMEFDNGVVLTQISGVDFEEVEN